ncbi:DUF2946 family protein [Ectopseudomonas mendocina]|uniref:DUF2946 family protein n=1 Tax=Ectopseudomonas mendocina TaxID=300 RepID=A0ABZ2RIE0_ECTME
MQAKRLSPVYSSLCLGLLAMLLISLGPLVSQLLQPAEPAWVSEMACGEHPSQHSEHKGHNELWAKCGYCTLLLHSPATGAATPRLSLPPAAPQQLAAPLALGLSSTAIFPGARSRAPPKHA